MNGTTTICPQTSDQVEPWVPHREFRVLDEREQYLKAELVRDRKRPPRWRSSANNRKNH